jgi:hypothetical protein
VIINFSNKTDIIYINRNIELLSIIINKRLWKVKSANQLYKNIEIRKVKEVSKELAAN